uniref:Uncharacterized protein n=1 Tax=Panagrolaimus davidi TaxID=227884 RepID=A0A914Q3Z1_9BILA
MEQIFLSVEYNGRRLNVWREDVHGYDRFFVTPLCVFDTSSVKCIQDKYSSENPNVFSFYVQLWDADAAGIVQLALKQKGIEVQPSDIIPLPMQMVRLSLNRNEKTSEITVDDRWRSYQGQPNGILFDLWTRTTNFCTKMVQDAKTDPETFLDRTKLYFEFTMFVGQKAERIINITDENEIIKELLNEIKGEKILSSQLELDEWKSVFWNDVFSKPDLQTNYLNEILTYDAKKDSFKYEEANDQKFIGDLENRYGRETIKSKKGEAGFIYGLIGGKVGGSTQTGNNENSEFINKTEIENSTYINKDNLQDYLDISKAMVKWSGEKFVPKELALQRINTKLMQTESEIFYKRVITTKLATTQELPLQVEPKYISNYSNSASPVFYEALQEAINKTDNKLNQFVNATANKIQEVFNNVTSEMQIERQAKDSDIKAKYDDLIQKLEDKTGQITAEINNVRSITNENKGVINNNFNHHETRVNQIWAEIDGIKGVLYDIKKDLTYACWMASKCHADRLKTQTWDN